MIDFIVENEILLPGKTKPSGADAKLMENLWEDVSSILNSCESGPTKTKAQWKKTFIDWKCLTRKKAREILQMERKPGSGKANRKVLTAAEKKLIDLMSRIDVRKPELDPEEVLEIPQSPLSEAMGPIDDERFHIAPESPIMQKIKLEHEDASYTPQNEAESFLEEQTAVMETLNKCNSNEWKANKSRELDFKEMELKIRLLEARNKRKELELKEIELKLKERELNILELKQ